jgi:putative two-component system response regulator
MKSTINDSPMQLVSRKRNDRDGKAKKPRILVVDDLPSNLKLMRVLLSSEGYLVSTAVDAEDGLLTVMDDAPDLIVTDLHMPGMGGVALIRGLKLNKSISHIPILAGYIHRYDGGRS